MTNREFIIGAYMDGDKPSWARIVMTFLILTIVFIDVWRAITGKDLYGIADRVTLIALLYGINKAPVVSATITGQNAPPSVPPK